MSALVSVNIPALRLDGRQLKMFMEGKCLKVYINPSYPLLRGNSFPVSDDEENYYVAIVWKKLPNSYYIVKKKSDD